MNANELANFLDKNAGEGETPIRQAVTMLRQQTLEIQALHQILGYEGIEVGQDYLNECVADLRKAQGK